MRHMSDDGGKRTLVCPCGTVIKGSTEDELVERVQEHLRTEHPELEYTRDEILWIAT